MKGNRIQCMTHEAVVNSRGSSRGADCVPRGTGRGRVIVTCLLQENYTCSPVQDVLGEICLTSCKSSDIPAEDCNSCREISCIRSRGGAARN